MGVMRIDVVDKRDGSEFYGLPVYAAALLDLPVSDLRAVLPIRHAMETERYMVRMSDTHPGERVTPE